MFDVIFNNRLLLGAIVFLLIVMVPALVVWGHKVRDVPSRERRKQARLGADRRA